LEKSHSTIGFHAEDEFINFGISSKDHLTTICMCNQYFGGVVASIAKARHNCVTLKTRHADWNIETQVAWIVKLKENWKKDHVVRKYSGKI
jgi:hypothetical protein